MKIATTNINNDGIILSKNAINKLIFKYNGVLGRALFKLYDLGYQCRSNTGSPPPVRGRPSGWWARR